MLNIDALVLAQIFHVLVYKWDTVIRIFVLVGAVVRVRVISLICMHFS